MRKTAPAPAEKAVKHVIMARLMEGYADDLSRMHFDAAERNYVEAGLDPDWFGRENETRECEQRCIPGHE